MDEKSDDELMALLAERSAPALGEVYRRYGTRLSHFLQRLTRSPEISQELLQELFVRVWFAASGYAAERSGGFRAWIYTVALNLARDEMSRKRYAYRYLEPEAADLEPRPRDLEAEPPARHQRREECRALRAALQRLRPHLREVVVLKNLQQLTFAEIARVVQAPESTVKARYLRAVAELRSALRPAQEESHDIRMPVQ